MNAAVVKPRDKAGFNMAMKIAVMVYSLDKIGGIAKHAILLSRAFAAMGHKVTIWSVEYDKDRCFPDLTRGLNIKSLRRPRLGADDTGPSSSGVRMARYMWNLLTWYLDQRRLSSVISDEYDVVNPHGNTISWAAVRYKKKYGTPIVWMCNDFWPIGSHRYEYAVTGLEKAKRATKDLVSRPFDRYDENSVRAIDIIAVLSELVGSQMRNHYAVEPVVVRAGVDHHRFATGDGRSVRSRHRVSDTTFLLLTVCELMPRRRIEDVIEAIEILVDKGHDVSYLIAGRTSHTPAYAQLLRTKVARANLDDRVTFSGEVSDKELIDSYHACDAFIWPSDRQQSWGMAGMEAMAARKPVIVSKENGLAEVLDDGRTALLVTPRSPGAIVEAVIRLIEDTGAANAMADQGEQLVREGYTWRRHADEMLTLFERTINEKLA